MEQNFHTRAARVSVGRLQPAGLAKKWLRTVRLCLVRLCTVLLCLSCVTNQAYSAVEQLSVKVLAEQPHDGQAFTQGLVLHEGYFYESTGLYGRSSLRKVDAVTGDIVMQKSSSGAFLVKA